MKIEISGLWIPTPFEQPTPANGYQKKRDEWRPPLHSLDFPKRTWASSGSSIWPTDPEEREEREGREDSRSCVGHSLAISMQRSGHRAVVEGIEWILIRHVWRGYGDSEVEVDEQHRHTSGGIAVGCDDACIDVPGTT